MQHICSYLCNLKHAASSISSGLECFNIHLNSSLHWPRQAACLAPQVHLPLEWVSGCGGSKGCCPLRRVTCLFSLPPGRNHRMPAELAANGTQRQEVRLAATWMLLFGRSKPVKSYRSQKRRAPAFSGRTPSAVARTGLHWLGVWERNQTVRCVWTMDLFAVFISFSCSNKEYIDDVKEGDFKDTRSPLWLLSATLKPLLGIHRVWFTAMLENSSWETHIDTKISWIRKSPRYPTIHANVNACWCNLYMSYWHTVVTTVTIGTHVPT